LRFAPETWEIHTRTSRIQQKIPRKSEYLSLPRETSRAGTLKASCPSFRAGKSRKTRLKGLDQSIKQKEDGSFVSFSSSSHPYKGPTSKPAIYPRLYPLIGHRRAQLSKRDANENERGRQLLVNRSSARRQKEVESRFRFLFLLFPSFWFLVPRDRAQIARFLVDFSPDRLERTCLSSHDNRSNSQDESSRSVRAWSEITLAHSRTWATVLWKSSPSFPLQGTNAHRTRANFDYQGSMTESFDEDWIWTARTPAVRAGISGRTILESRLVPARCTAPRNPPLARAGNRDAQHREPVASSGRLSPASAHMCLPERATANSWSAWVDNDRPTWSTPADRLNVLSAAGGPALSCFSPLAASGFPLAARSRAGCPDRNEPEPPAIPDVPPTVVTAACRGSSSAARTCWTTDRAAPALHRLRFHRSSTNRTELVWLSAWLERSSSVAPPGTPLLSLSSSLWLALCPSPALHV